MNNIAYQPNLFQIRRGTNHKEYRELTERLSIIDRVLTVSGMEFEFAEYHLEQVRRQTAMTVGKGEVEFTAKQIRRYTAYAIQALRCNYLRHELQTSLRETAFLLAASEDFQRFVFAGDLASAWCPGKTKLNDFAAIVPEEFICRLNELLQADFTADSATEKYELSAPLDDKTIWLDATCLEANIHFPVDWVLLRDAVRTLTKGILCLRRHGLKHRIPAPESFLSQINALCMEMANGRRRKDADKHRKKVLRRMKKVCAVVGSHGRRYRDLLHAHRDKTDLSEKEAARIIARFDQVLEQLPAAIEQAHRRIIRGEKLMAEEKILSFYDDTAAAIVRGKSEAEIEFGNELLIAEQRNGFITDWQLYDTKTADQRKLRDFMASLAPERRLDAIATDRGFDGNPGRRLLEERKIYNAICPKSPAELEKRNTEQDFQALQQRRSQTEGRIAAVKRFIGSCLPCRDFEAKQRHVAWAVLSHNLHLLAKLIHQAQAEKEDSAATA